MMNIKIQYAQPLVLPRNVRVSRMVRHLRHNEMVRTVNRAVNAWLYSQA